MRFWWSIISYFEVLMTMSWTHVWVIGKSYCAILFISSASEFIWHKWNGMANLIRYTQFYWKYWLYEKVDGTKCYTQLKLVWATSRIQSTILGWPAIYFIRPSGQFYWYWEILRIYYIGKPGAILDILGHYWIKRNTIAFLLKHETYTHYLCYIELFVYIVSRPWPFAYT